MIERELKEPLGSIDCESRCDFWEVLWGASRGMNVYVFWTLEMNW